jgi:hypothetical protein
MERKAYPSDVTDDEWAFVAPSAHRLYGDGEVKFIYQGAGW